MNDTEHKEYLSKRFLNFSDFKTICQIDYNWLDRIITEFFMGKEFGGALFESYESAVYEEWCNDSTHSFTVRKVGQIHTSPLIRDAKNAKWEKFALSDYLNHLCKEGIVPECELIVNVCW